MNKLVHFFAAAVCATAAFAGDRPKNDHLTPEMSEFAFGYELRSVGSPKDFPELYENDVIVRSISELSFLGEFGVGIAEKDGIYRAIHFERLSRNNRSKTGCERPIETDVARRVIGAWRAVLLGTRFSEDIVVGTDGATHHFSMTDTFEQPPGLPQRLPLFGMVWSPDVGSPPHDLVLLASGLGEYCTSKDDGHRREITRSLIEIANRINSGTN